MGISSQYVLKSLHTQQVRIHIGMVGICSALHSSQRHLRLGQPEGHVHGTIHRDSHGQCSAGLFPLAYRGIQRAEAVVGEGQGGTGTVLAESS
jgi:hypothetical protein